MKRMSLSKTTSTTLFFVGTIAAASVFAQPPQGAYGPGYGMDPGMMDGYGPGPGNRGGYGPGSGFNRTR